jgi:hypothetical protein
LTVVLWNTKWALIFSCCAFSLDSFVKFPFTDFQDNMLIMVSLPPAHCYNAYCTLLAGQLNFHKLPNLQLHIVKSTFSHFHFCIANLTSLHYSRGCPKFSDCPLKNRLLAQFILSFFWPNLFFWAVLQNYKL